MLYFVDHNQKEYSWHVGEPLPKIIGPTLEVQADGHELQFLISRFRNLPHLDPMDRPIQSWKHDLAQFIFDNFPKAV